FELLRVLERCASEFTHITVIPNLFGVASLWVSTKDLGGVLGLQIRQNLLVPFNRWLKRAIDLCLAAALGLLALPVIAVAALWIKLVSPGSAFYTQERAGEGGHLIRIRKLRTMYPDADATLDRYLGQHPEAHREWNAFFKLKHDPRVLPGIGQI